MITNQIIQSTIDGVCEISGVNLIVLDREANVLAQTDSDNTNFSKEAHEFIGSDEDNKVISKNHFFKIYDDEKLSFVVIAKGDSEESKKIGRLAVLQLDSLLVAYRERYDKDDFVKNLLLDNMLLVDIMNRARKLHIEMSARRVVFIVETEREKDANVLDTVRGLFAGGSKDFITAVEEKDIIVVKELSDEETYEDLDRIAHILVDMLGSEAMTSARVAYGTMVGDIREVSRSYKEAKMALDVGGIFYSERSVIAYSNLGIGRLIYQLPLPLCKMFINEIFGTDKPMHFDEEILSTVDQFFACNLNVSKTSRELYIHRNTLVYRLDKLKNMTGLDIQTFDDAITFQIALMVMKYMIYLENME